MSCACEMQITYNTLPTHLTMNTIKEEVLSNLARYNQLKQVFTETIVVQLLTLCQISKTGFTSITFEYYTRPTKAEIANLAKEGVVVNCKQVSNTDYRSGGVSYNWTFTIID